MATVARWPLGRNHNVVGAVVGDGVHGVHIHSTWTVVLVSRGWVVQFVD